LTLIAPWLRPRVFTLIYKEKGKETERKKEKTEREKQRKGKKSPVLRKGFQLHIFP